MKKTKKFGFYNTISFNFKLLATQPDFIAWDKALEFDTFCYKFASKAYVHNRNFAGK